MAEQRRILTAQRAPERRFHPSQEVEEGPKRGPKRPLPECGAKNKANDRLKRLRTQINEEVKQIPLNTQKRHRRKRSGSSNVHSEATTSKLLRNERGTASSSQHATVFKLETAQERLDCGVSENQLKPEEMDWIPCEESSQVSTNSTSQEVLVIVDTNVFLSNLELIKDITLMKINGTKKPIIYIPWIVIEELDFIKDDRNAANSLKKKAQDAVKFINNALKTNDSRMKGQTFEEVNSQAYTGSNQDNKIIACCLLLLQNNKDLILLTNDINLKNKAHINNIPICDRNEILSKIRFICRKSTKVTLILEKMKTICSTVIGQCAQKAYGDVWNRMEAFRTSPATIKDCLVVFKRYWFTVFEQELMKQCKKALQDFEGFLLRNSDMKDDTETIDELLRHCVRVCLFFKDVQGCKDAIECTIREFGLIKEL